MSDVSRLLRSIQSGNHLATADLLPLVYEELRALAASHVARESHGQSLSATALVHEAWLRLVDGGDRQLWENRRHFFGAAAIAMRRILVDRARKRARLRHGGVFVRKPIDLDQLPDEVVDDEILDLHEALEDFARHDATKAKLVELRFFSGMPLPEAAQMLGMSLSTADRAWRYARAWLYAAMKPSGEENRSSVT